MTKPRNMMQVLESVFGNRVQRDVPLARFTSARVGGPADAFIEATSSEELADIVQRLWDLNIPFALIGGGSNILVSDKGVRGCVVLNRAKEVKFNLNQGKPTVWSESGASFGLLARQAASHGLSGLEWAVGIPGTVGGAVFGNAGAHGKEVADNLLLAEILHRDGIRETWTAQQFQYRYRSSVLKRHPGKSVILTATFELVQDEPATIHKRIDEYRDYRKRTQPPGASVGSMFKNPPGDYAGRLIEQAGLKGLQIGGAAISDVHANFFINHGNATAMDIHRLIEIARDKVWELFGVRLELEIEYLGEWDIED